MSVFFIIAGVTTPPESSKNTPVQTVAPVKAVTASVKATPETDQQKLEDSLKKNVSQFSGATQVSYKSLEVDDAVAGYEPVGTKDIYVKVEINSMWNKSSMINETGTLSSTLFQTLYKSNINANDMCVWYYGKTTDRYGNSSDGIIQTYCIDQDTYSKINWQGFDQTTLCAFLNQEVQFAGDSTSDGCKTLAQIQ